MYLNLKIYAVSEITASVRLREHFRVCSEITVLFWLTLLECRHGLQSVDLAEREQGQNAIKVV